MNTKTHLLEFSTVIHVVIERPRVIRLRDLICRVYQIVNDVSLLFTLFRGEKTHSGFRT